MLVGEGGVPSNDCCIRVDVLWPQVLRDWLSVGRLVTSDVRILGGVLVTPYGGVCLILVLVDIRVCGRSPTVGLVVVVVSADVINKSFKGSSDVPPFHKYTRRKKWIPFLSVGC